MARTLTIIIMIAFVTLSGCQKYEEGPNITIRSFKKRLEGTYRIDGFEVNGVDMLDSLKTELYYCEKIQIALPERKYTKIYLLFCGRQVWNSYADKSNNTLSHEDPLAGAYTTTGFECFLEGNLIWNIIRLSNRELWLETTINGVVFQLKLWKYEY